MLLYSNKTKYVKDALLVLFSAGFSLFSRSSSVPSRPKALTPVPPSQRFLHCPEPL